MESKNQGSKKIQRLCLAGTKAIKDMTDVEAQLLALLIDAEGCISAGISGECDIVHPSLSVNMRTQIPVETAQKWGGALFKRWEKGKWTYRWAVAQRASLRVILLKIKPYLQLKQKQAELALEMCDVADRKAQGWKEELKRLKAEINALNPPPSLDIDITKLKNVVVRYHLATERR